ncbi:ParA family protein [Paludibaculum fermentans]|uniref:ParA family protein n=1 Tax=Paludibaculum fermentans TaxID=1473598 RepID=A0A7S7SPK6_PALFE|nr:ParA family protein [Paludibaculum fermentans]QOY91701.1 ParA family protein [Paludibaculum fermentans]
MNTIAFFNNKGGVGKTSLVYHLAWMFADRGVSVLAVDLDPQANLTAMFLNEEELEGIWPDAEEHPATIYGAVRPILRGLGDIEAPPVVRIQPNLGLLPGDLGLSRFEDKLSAAWPNCHNSDEAAFRTMSAFHRIMAEMAGDWAELVLIDVGPNLGAINRAALIASDRVCLPLAPDLYSLQGLRNLGPTLMRWRTTWAEMKLKAPVGLSLPIGSMTPTGYVVMQHSMRDSRPVKAYQRWMDRIPQVYRAVVLGEAATDGVPKVEQDPNCLAQLKHYRSLMPLAMEAHKPMFHLKPADGAIGAHVEAVRDCRNDFLRLAQKVGASAGVSVA